MQTVFFCLKQRLLYENAAISYSHNGVARGGKCPHGKRFYMLDASPAFTACLPLKDGGNIFHQGHNSIRLRIQIKSAYIFASFPNGQFFNYFHFAENSISLKNLPLSKFWFGYAPVFTNFEKI